MHELGITVHALFLVSGNTHNSRCFGPYVIKKMLDDLKYIIGIPDERKQSQLQHVNMLKPYLGGSSNLVKQVAGFNGVVSEPKELGPVVSRVNG